MINRLRKFLTTVAICMTCVVLAMPGAMAAANMPTNGDVGNYGVWATDHNKSLFVNSLTTDIESFQKPFQENVLVKDYVPIEAKVGRAFIGAMSVVGEVLERSLVRFVSIFIIVMFIFWIMLEAYHMMRATQKSRELLETILKAAIWIFVWIWIIEQGPAQLFMWIMGPVISIGTYLSDLILESVVTASGASLPDTCAAIHKYVVSTQTGTTLVDSVQTADLLCVPTRLSGFFYTAVAAGWKWMLAGIGQSVFTFVAGATFVVIFIYNIWKFALMALGVIADLFLVILMLPFTAISETFGKMKLSNSKGYPEQILEGFMGIFQTQSLSSQIQKFISAVIYFISLSIVIAVCAAILSGVIDSNLAATIPTLENEGFMITLIVGCLVAYLANKAGQIATDFGGAVGNGLPNLESDIQKVWSNTSETAKSWWKILRKKT